MRSIHPLRGATAAVVVVALAGTLGLPSGRRGSGRMPSSAATDVAEDRELALEVLAACPPKYLQRWPSVSW